MSKTSCKEMNRIVYRRLVEIQMSAFDRQSAAQAMRDAEVIADAVIWVKEGIASFGAMLLKPVYKH